MPENRTVLKGDATGGLLDSLINKGKLPSIEIQISQNTMVRLGIMIVISITIVVLVTNIFKATFLKN